MKKGEYFNPISQPCERVLNAFQAFITQRIQRRKRNEQHNQFFYVHIDLAEAKWIDLDNLDLENDSQISR